MKQNKKTKKIQKSKKTSIFGIVILGIYILMIAFFLSFYIGYYYGTKTVITESTLNNALNSVINRYSINNNVNGLYSEKVNNITVYSDLNNFTRINKIVTQLDLQEWQYSNLNGIIYYQNKSPDGYYEHLQDQSCDGTYNIIGKFVTMYRCDGTMILRGFNVSEKDSEKFIL